MPHTPAARLRAAMDAGCTAIPGAFNALCARAIARAGFKACYISGAATSVCAGVPDVGLLTLEHFARTIREAADAARDEHGRPLPILADADTGFGEAEMVRRTVIEYARAGAAGLHLEDQKFPKRCGHLDGKELVPADHMAEKIQWAVKAANDLDAEDRRRSGTGVPPVRSAFLICARTDARGVEGFDAAIARAKLYIEAGADMIFPEGLATEEEFAKFASSLRASVPSSLRPYLLANMTEFGKTPMIPLSRFGEMGYSCVIYPVSLLRIAMGAVTRALEQLKKDGSVEALLPQMQTRKELYDLIGYTPGVPWEFHA
ncbi:MAG: isocitrate lyase/phosphoenolpyruvate mutase family protein [Phycisphaerales bacterium]|nr:isocitrate lyase/phosphoenolpyruvate mutase family protein [Phycisphaerales bacterium]